MDIIHQSSFWVQAWQEARRQSLYGRALPGRQGSAWWDRRAAGFAARGRGGEAQKRLAKVLHMLGHHGGLEPEAEVLDIGCGPGNYALALARRVKKVVALDPSPAMLSLLKARMEEEGIHNIEPVQLSWEEVDLDGLGWRGRFRVVLALMTPGIHDVATLKKMIDASAGICLLAGHLRQEEEARRELWSKVMGGPLPSLPEDALYVFSLLYSWGYLPSLELELRSSSREIPAGEAVEELLNFFYPYTELTEKVRQAVEDYVNARSRDGIYLQKKEFVTAYLCWSVEISG
ncbi:MAG: class I SAM-dependent methyltransferase [Thermoanaerobacteraceae bacterium]|nr:class I SAM-dependent methyltransferase [Thermoanaerobacteraceae bacterium]